MRRKVIADGMCDRCKQVPEDVVHALYGCPNLDDLWKQTKWNNGALKYFTSFLDLFDFILAGSSDVELFASITWNLWNHRNNLRLGKPTIPLDKVLEHSWEQHLSPTSAPHSSQLADSSKTQHGLHRIITGLKRILMGPLSPGTTKQDWEL